MWAAYTRGPPRTDDISLHQKKYERREKSRRQAVQCRLYDSAARASRGVNVACVYIYAPWGKEAPARDNGEAINYDARERERKVEVYRERPI